jgi:hypothetical protein
MTLDFVHQNSKEENTFNEISIRYPKNSGKEIGLKFEKYIKTIGIITCPNQVDWPINKFDILKILN